MVSPALMDTASAELTFVLAGAADIATARCLAAGADFEGCSVQLEALAEHAGGFGRRRPAEPWRHSRPAISGADGKPTRPLPGEIPAGGPMLCERFTAILGRWGLCFKRHKRKKSRALPVASGRPKFGTKERRDAKARECGKRGDFLTRLYKAQVAGDLLSLATLLFYAGRWLSAGRHLRGVG